MYRKITEEEVASVDKFIAANPNKGFSEFKKINPKASYKLFVKRKKMSLNVSLSKIKSLIKKHPGSTTKQIANRLKVDVEFIYASMSNDNDIWENDDNILELRSGYDEKAKKVITIKKPVKKVTLKDKIREVLSKEGLSVKQLSAKLSVKPNTLYATLGTMKDMKNVNGLYCIKKNKEVQKEKYLLIDYNRQLELSEGCGVRYEARSCRITDIDAYNLKVTLTPITDGDHVVLKGVEVVTIGCRWVKESDCTLPKEVKSDDESGNKTIELRNYIDPVLVPFINKLSEEEKADFQLMLKKAIFYKQSAEALLQAHRISNI